MLIDRQVPKEKAREWLSLPIDVPVLLFFGTIREYKGLRDLLVAIPEIRTRLGKIVLLVVGEFWEEKQPYLEIIKRLGIDDLVIIEDRYIPNEEIAIYFSAADVLVAPYQHVTGSAVVQLAQGFGLPVVTTVRDSFKVASPILVVSQTDPITLAQAISCCYALQNQSKNPSQQAYEFSWKRLVKAIERGST
jgi:glycosyltransferase involved in cell wall biosynthesis